MEIKQQLQQETLRLLATRAEADERIKEIKAMTRQRREAAKWSLFEKA